MDRDYGEERTRDRAPRNQGSPLRLAYYNDDELNGKAADGSGESRVSLVTTHRCQHNDDISIVPTSESSELWSRPKAGRFALTGMEAMTDVMTRQQE